MPPVRTFLLLLALIYSNVFVADAQQRPESIPRDLAVALLAGFGPPDEQPEILVGRAPDGLPPGVLPPGGEVLGGTVRERGSSVVVRVPQAPDAALAVLEGRLAAAGWKSPAASPFERGGFVAGPFARLLSFCLDDQFLTASASPSDGGSLLRVNVSPGGMRPPCGEEPMRRPGMPDAPVPRLVPPPEARAHGTSGGGGGDHWESSTRLETRLGPAELLAHYSSQLQRAGWSAEAALEGSEVAARTLRLRDPEGQQWYGVLVATSLPGSGEREVLFRAMRRSSR